MESPDIRFYDEERAKLNNGIANISLDPIFIEAIEADVGYNVFLTPLSRTKGIYVAEQAEQYFIVKSFTPNSNIAFSWLISAIRKGYKDIRLDLERKEDLEIIAVIDETTQTTEVQLSPNSADLSQSTAQTANQTQTAIIPENQTQTNQQTANQPQTSQETQQNTSQDNTSLVISGGQATSNIGNLSQPNSVAGITGNVINEAGLETDLTNILEPSTNATTETATSEVVPMPQLQNNLINENIANNQSNIGEGQQTNEIASSPNAAIDQSLIVNQTSNTTINNATSAMGNRIRKTCEKIDICI